MRRILDSAGVAALFLLLGIAALVLVPGEALGAEGIDYIVIVDAPGGAGSWVSSRDYLFGDSDVFWAAGYNNTTGFVSDVTVYWWTGANPPPDPGGTGGGLVIRTNTTYGPSVRVDTNGYGVATLTAWYYDQVNRTSTLTNETGPLRVSVDNVDSVVIRSDRGGTGTWIGDTLYDLGDRDTFYAAAYNDTDGFLGDIVSNWTSTNASVGYVWPASGNYTQGCAGGGTAYPCYPLVTFYAVGVGFTYITAEPVGTPWSNTTGKLTVTTIVTDYLQIRDAPNGGGTALGDRTYYTAEQDTFYAASYNLSIGYLGDVAADWTSSDPSVCEVRGYYQGTAHGASVQLLLKAPGTCTVSATASTPTGTVTNTTGTLTVNARTLVTVDDSGGADFTVIQDAVDFAQDGYKVFVYAGTYPEHVVVTKELEIQGESKGSVFIDGSGTGTALFLGADRIVVHDLTVRNAVFAVFQDATNNTRLYDTVISDYGTGLFNDHTLNAWVAYNTITRGSIGVLTNESYDDAIRWNTISYNTVYGAKSYNTRLRNCFNWNTFHNNKVAYFHDPTTEYPPMEFDGNVLTDNEVGVKVENASSVRLTNNTIAGGLEGVQLLNSSSEVDSNTFTGVGIGIRCRSSGSNLTNNAITAADAGIVCDGGSPRIEGNDIAVTSGEGLVLSNLDGAIVAGNDLHGGTLRVTNSRLAVLAPVDSVVLLEDTFVETLILDGSSRVEIRWSVIVRAVDSASEPVPGASVVVRDRTGVIALEGLTGPDGSLSGILHAGTLRSVGADSRNPFTFTVTAPQGTASRTLGISAPSQVVLAVQLPSEPDAGAGRSLFLVALAAATLASASLAATFGIERSRYALLALFVPLYTRLSKDKVLESYNRGRVFEYIELNPGAHFNGILAALGLNNGSLVYHLEVLQREGLVSSRQEGMYRRFYPKGVQLPPLLENGTTEAQLRVLRAIQEMPGITQKELARFLGLRQSTLEYQIDRLSAMGYIAQDRRGRKVHYRAKRDGT